MKFTGKQIICLGLSVWALNAQAQEVKVAQAQNNALSQAAPETLKAPTEVITPRVEAFPNLPQNPTLVGGSQAHIVTTGKTMTITPSQQNTLINWERFDIGAGHRVHHNHPTGAHVTVHNVTGGQRSNISGILSANQGTVFLINPSGTVFTKGSQIDMGANGKFIATSYSLKDQNAFLQKGDLTFAPNQYAGTITIKGTLSFKAAGIGFIAPNIDGEYMIVGQSMDLVDQGDALDVSFFDDRFKIRMEGKTAEALRAQQLENEITTLSLKLEEAKSADKKLTVMTADQVAEGLDNLVTADVVEARDIETKAVGDVWLVADPDHGRVEIKNDITLSAEDSAAGRLMVSGGEIIYNKGTLNLSAPYTPGHLQSGVLPGYKLLNKLSKSPEQIFTNYLTVNDGVIVDVRSTRGSKSGRVNWLSKTLSTFGKATVHLGNGWLDFSGISQLEGVSNVLVTEKGGDVIYDPKYIRILPGDEDAAPTSVHGQGSTLTDQWLNNLLESHNVYISTNNAGVEESGDVEVPTILLDTHANVHWNANYLILEAENIVVNGTLQYEGNNTGEGGLIFSLPNELSYVSGRGIISFLSDIYSDRVADPRLQADNYRVVVPEGTFDRGTFVQFTGEVRYPAGFEITRPNLNEAAFRLELGPALPTAVDIIQDAVFLASADVAPAGNGFTEPPFPVPVGGGEGSGSESEGRDHNAGRDAQSHEIEAPEFEGGEAFEFDEGGQRLNEFNEFNEIFYENSEEGGPQNLVPLVGDRPDTGEGQEGAPASGETSDSQNANEDSEGASSDAQETDEDQEDNNQENTESGDENNDGNTSNTGFNNQRNIEIQGANLADDIADANQ